MLRVGIIKFIGCLLNMLLISLVIACSPEKDSTEQKNPSPTESQAPSSSPTDPMMKGLTTEELLDRGVVEKDENLAIKYYNEALKIEYLDPFIYDMRATAYEALGKKACPEICQKGSPEFQQRVDFYNRAISDYTVAVKLDPWYEGGYRSRGRVYVLLGEFEKAIKDFSKILTFSPEDADILNNRAIAYVYSGGFEKALADLTKAIELKPDPSFYTARSRVFREMKQYDLAIDDATDAIDLKANFAGGFYARGLALKLQNKCTEAEVDFKKACTFAPNSLACKTKCP